jgi:hypothetical protein
MGEVCFAYHIMRYLGFLIDTQRLPVTWPLDKREDLCSDIEEALCTRQKVDPRLLAHVFWENYRQQRSLPRGASTFPPVFDSP